MAVLCLLTNTPWPWPTPAGAASARGGVPHPERSGGRPQAGLHKRSAEDWGASCARQGRSPSGRLGFLACFGWSAGDALALFLGERCGQERGRYLHKSRQHMVEMIRRRNGFRDLASKQAVEHAIMAGRGNVDLLLTSEPGRDWDWPRTLSAAEIRLSSSLKGCLFAAAGLLSDSGSEVAHLGGTPLLGSEFLAIPGMRQIRLQSLPPLPRAKPAAAFLQTPPYRVM
jgi:hypothetical protein